jgi:hypothetical protein
MMSGGGSGPYLNWLALVAYVPDPLGSFLDELRRTLVPSCMPHSHVSILPPRPVGVPHQAAADQVRSILQAFGPFEVEATDVRIFPVTDVIYLEIGAGNRDLRRMHRALNTGHLAFSEPFDYYPHITLAQDLLPGQVQPLLDRARREWAGSPLPGRFAVNGASLVRNARPDLWKDLEIFTLNGVHASR